MENNKLLLFKQEFPIRFQDMDGLRHVNNSVYYIYMQETRIDWLQQNGISITETHEAPVVIETSCKYLRQITYPATICIETYFDKLDGKKAHISHIIRDSVSGKVYAEGTAVSVWVDFKIGRSIELPEKFQQMLHTMFKE